MTKTMELTRNLRWSTLWATDRDELNARREAAAAQARLRRELADYSTPAERNDLNALLDTYPDTEVDELRTLLNRAV